MLTSISPTGYADPGIAPSDQGVDVVAEDQAFTIPAAALDRALGEADTTLERSAVNSYLADDSVSNVALTPEDVSAGTLKLGDELKAVVVAPEVGGDLESLRVTTDAESDSVSLGTQSVDTDEPVAAGPGMGGFPSWDKATQYTVVLKLYYTGNKDPDHIASAEFSTLRRWTDGDGSGDKWQVARYAVGKPGKVAWAGPDGDATVNKLWISNDLTDATQKYARQWLPDKYTSPNSRQEICSSRGIDAGPWSFGANDCGEYDPWRGDPPNDVGHFRLSYDQGFYSTDGQREAAYVAGFLMAEGRSPRFTHYEFIRIQTGLHGHSYSFDPWVKCSSNTLGAAGSSTVEKCYFK